MLWIWSGLAKCIHRGCAFFWSAQIPCFLPRIPYFGVANPLISPLFSFSFTSILCFSSCLFMNYAHFPDFCQIFFSHQTHNGSFSGCVALICDCWVQHNSNHFPVSHWDGSMTYREISVSHWLVWITYRARPLSDTVNVYYNIYIFFLYVLWHYPYCCFLSLFYFFSHMRAKARNEGSPFTSAPEAR